MEVRRHVYRMSLTAQPHHQRDVVSIHLPLNKTIKKKIPGAVQMVQWVKVVLACYQV